MILFLKCPSLGFVKGRASVCLGPRVQPGQAEPCGVRFWGSSQRDPQAASVILSEGTPGHAAFYRCRRSVARAALGPRGRGAPDALGPSLPPFLPPAESDQGEVS